MGVGIESEIAATPRDSILAETMNVTYAQWGSLHSGEPKRREAWAQAPLPCRWA